MARASSSGSAATPSSRACARSSRFTRSARGHDDQLQEPLAAPRPARSRGWRSASGSWRSADARATRCATRTSTCSRRSSRAARGCRFVPAALLVLGLAALLIGLARPQVERMLLKDRATVILVVDTSRSMQAEDVAPTRLGAAQEAIQDVPRQCAGRPAYRPRRVRRRGAGGDASDAAITSSCETAVVDIDEFLVFGGPRSATRCRPRSSSASR